MQKFLLFGILAVLLMSACGSGVSLSQEAQDHLQSVVDAGTIGRGSYEIKNVQIGKPQFNQKEAYCITIHTAQGDEDVNVFLQGTPGGMWNGFVVEGPEWNSQHSLWNSQCNQ